LVAQPRHQHSPESKSLGPFQGHTCGPVEKEHQPNENKYDHRRADQFTSFEASHDTALLFFSSFQSIDNDWHRWRNAVATFGDISNHRQVGTLHGSEGNSFQPGRFNGHQAVSQSMGHCNHIFSKIIDPLLLTS
jgi:hypothetical protein